MTNGSEILSMLVFNFTNSIQNNVTLLNMVNSTQKIFVFGDNKSKNYAAVEYTGGNYYYGGVFFMASVLGLLMYVNFYYENCFTQTCIDISKWKVCCCMRYIFKKRISMLQKSPKISEKKRSTSRSPMQISSNVDSV